MLAAPEPRPARARVREVIAHDQKVIGVALVADDGELAVEARPHVEADDGRSGGESPPRSGRAGSRRRRPVERIRRKDGPPHRQSAPHSSPRRAAFSRASGACGRRAAISAAEVKVLAGSARSLAGTRSSVEFRSIARSTWWSRCPSRWTKWTSFVATQGIPSGARPLPERAVAAAGDQLGVDRERLAERGQKGAVLREEDEPFACARAKVARVKAGSRCLAVRNAA